LTRAPPAAAGGAHIYINPLILMQYCRFSVSVQRAVNYGNLAPKSKAYTDA
jgi:hypothetical protein